MFKRLFSRRRRQNNTASIAKERLQIIVAHERRRNEDGNPDFMQDLQRDILLVVQKYLPVEGDQINIAMDKEGECDVLELNILLDPAEEGEKKAKSEQNNSEK